MTIEIGRNLADLLTTIVVFGVLAYVLVKYK